MPFPLIFLSHDRGLSRICLLLIGLYAASVTDALADTPPAALQSVQISQSAPQEAAASLLEAAGASVAAIFAVVGLPFLNYRRLLAAYSVQTLIEYQGE